MLATYLTDTRDLLNDGQGQFFPEQTLIRNINRSRRRIAAMSGCIRLMPPGVMSVPNQETYPFKAWEALVQTIPGAHSILACRSLAMSIGGKWQNGVIVGGAWKPVWKRLIFTDFQAHLRIYGGTFMGQMTEPGWFTQYGEGPAAILYLAPIPTMSTPMEVDLTLIPMSLETDDDPDPIPYPWIDAVPWWAAVLSLLQQQRREDAEAMALLFNTDLPICASVVCPQLIQNAYGATLRSA